MPVEVTNIRKYKAAFGAAGVDVMFLMSEAAPVQSLVVATPHGAIVRFEGLFLMWKWKYCFRAWIRKEEWAGCSYFEFGAALLRPTEALV